MAGAFLQRRFNLTQFKKSCLSKVGTEQVRGVEHGHVFWSAGAVPQLFGVERFQDDLPVGAQRCQAFLMYFRPKYWRKMGINKPNGFPRLVVFKTEIPDVHDLIIYLDIVKFGQLKGLFTAFLAKVNSGDLPTHLRSKNGISTLTFGKQ